MAESRLYRLGDKWSLDIPVPNPALQEWLNGPECEAQLRKVAGEILTLYTNALPQKTGRLREGAAKYVRRRGVRGQTERWHAWVSNYALSYKPVEGKPYPRFIEYGKRNADGGRTKAGYQLRWAAEQVANRRLTAAARTVLGEAADVGAEHHQARPAAKPKQQTTRASIDLTKAPKRNLTQQERAKIRAQREAEARARFNANKKPPAQRPRPPQQPPRRANPFYDDPREGD